MSVLALKLVRDLWQARWQYLAVGTMILLGVAFFGAAYMMYRNLEASYARSYDRLRFEHFGIAFYAAPEQAADRVRRIPGVAAVEGRLVEDVIVELPGRTTKTLMGRLISLPANRRPQVNDVFVTQGRYVRGRTAREILLEGSFAAYHRLRPGDVVDVVRGGGRARLHVAGIVQSPEYVFVVRSKQDLMPFPETFGVMFISGDVLRPLVGKTGLINEIRATVTDPARLPAVMREAQRVLRAYRPEDPVARRDQPSYQLLDQDLQGLRMYSVLFPFFFLSVAGLTVYTLLVRMVHLQRPVIGLLRALGFTRHRVVAHYLAAAGVIGAMSSAGGTLLGYWVAGGATRWYASFISVPYVIAVPRWDVMAAGFFIGAGTCLLAGVLPARATARIRAAEALRTPVLAAGRVVALDRLVPGVGRMRLVWRLPFRNVLRHPRRTISTLFGVSAASALIMTAQGLLDSAEAALDTLLRQVFHDDIRVEFVRAQDRTLVSRVRSWPGVVWAEGALELPVEFHRGPVTYAALAVGLEPGSQLQRLTTEDGTPLRLGDAGVVLGQTLRAKLGVEPGDLVEVSVLRRRAEDEPRRRTVRVAATVWEPIGTIAYLPADRLRQLFRREVDLPKGAISGIRVKADPRHLGEIRVRLLQLPDAAAVTTLRDLQGMFENLMGMMRRFIALMLAFGMALAFAITFNMVTINVLERSNEVATMRTIGVDGWVILGMITVENLLTALIGVALGLPLGRLTVEGFLRAAQTEEQMELFAMKVVVNPQTYVLTATAIVIVVLLSQLPSILQVNRLDLARATKERVT
ncbi:MAG: FtsX-like permease family protein [Armatimonadota bacterium]|nr:FtsX-like permease family protein [Armatimonadota bacterium]